VTSVFLTSNACGTTPKPELPRSLSTAGSTGRRNTFHPYRQGLKSKVFQATSLNDDPRVYKHE
jgi:hypothetical protein